MPLNKYEAKNIKLHAAIYMIKLLIAKIAEKTI